LAFGIAGLILVIGAAALVLGSLAAVNQAATGFEQQRQELAAMIEPASAALSDAADAAEHAGGSLTAASDASRRAADLTNRLAASFESMAGLGSFEIFGTKPFAGVTSQFTDTATQSRALSTDLTATADALGTNVADSQAVAADLRTLADRLDQIEASLRGAGGDGDAAASSGMPIALATALLLGLLAWLSVPAIAAIWLGRMLLRPRSRGPQPPAEGVI
jgi:hypothetical protein